jgi:hypothetical protein
MTEYTYETLRAAFSDPDRYVIPPGSMTLEPEQGVAGKFADAWQEQVREREDELHNTYWAGHKDGSAILNRAHPPIGGSGGGPLPRTPEKLRVVAMVTYWPRDMGEIGGFKSAEMYLLAVADQWAASQEQVRELEAREEALRERCPVPDEDGDMDVGAMMSFCELLATAPDPPGEEGT